MNEDQITITAKVPHGYAVGDEILVNGEPFVVSLVKIDRFTVKKPTWWRWVWYKIRFWWITRPWWCR